MSLLTDAPVDIWPAMRALGWTGPEEMNAPEGDLSPLRFAVAHGSSDALPVFVALLRAGATEPASLVWDPILMTFIHEHGDHPEAQAIAAFMVECGADPNARNPEGESILMCCMTHGFDLVDTLASHGLDPSSVNPEGENDLFELRFVRGGKTAVWWLGRLLPLGFDLDAPSLHGQSARTVLGQKFAEVPVWLAQREAGVLDRVLPEAEPDSPATARPRI